MILAWLQFAIVLALTGYLLSVLSYLHRRNQMSWDDLVAQWNKVRSNTGDPGSNPTGQTLQMEGGVTVEVDRPLLLDLSSLRARFQNARAILEMADYIERNALPESAIPDLQALRRDAMKIRLEALISLPRDAFSS